MTRCMVSRGVVLPQSQNQARWYSEEKAEEKTDEKTDEKTEEKTEEPTTDSNSDSDSKNNVELERTKEKLKEMEKKWKMALADQQNYKKIMERDLKNAREYAIESFAKQMIDVSDNLTRGLQNAEKEEEPSVHFTALIDGLKLTHDSLHKGLKSNGIKEFLPLGEEFDPNQHSALYMRPPQEGENSNQIIEVVSSGFTIKERVLRSATVGVAKK